MKFAVIGSGPCGSLAALLLLQAGHQVELFDVDSDDSLDPDGLTSKLKLVGSSSAPYDIQQILQVTKSGAAYGIYRSKSMGGFSNVWGATWGAQPSLEGFDWLEHHGSVTQLLLEDGYLGEKSNTFCDCFHTFTGRIEKLKTLRNTKVENTLLAINPSKCDCIASGLASCTHGGVWNSRNLIKRCQAFDHFSFNSGKDVVKIEKIDSGLLVKGNSFSAHFDSVIIAAGSIGTVELLLNSLPSTSSITLKDTRMAYLPLVRIGNRTKHKGGFAFSQYSVNTLFGKNELASHIQLYSDPEIYKDRILGKLPKFVLSFAGPFLNLMLPHLALAIIYVDAESSPRVRFKKADNERKLIVDFLPPSFQTKGLKSKLGKVFGKLGFLPLLPILSWSNPGESYHLGAIENDILDEFGTIREIPGLHVAGAISLPDIEPGPITHSAMAQTSRLIKKLLTKI